MAFVKMMMMTMVKLGVKTPNTCLQVRPMGKVFNISGFHLVVVRLMNQMMMMMVRGVLIMTTKSTEEEKNQSLEILVWSRSVAELKFKRKLMMMRYEKKVREIDVEGKFIF